MKTEANISVHQYGLTLERAQQLQVQLKKLMGRGASIEVDTDEPPLLEKEQDMLQNIGDKIDRCHSDFDPEYYWESLADARKDLNDANKYIARMTVLLKQLSDTVDKVSSAVETEAAKKKGKANGKA